MCWQSLSFDELNVHQLYAILRLRQEIFVVEQDCVFLDTDGLDLDAIHIVCWQDNQPMAYLRSLGPGLAYEQSSLGRIVVPESSRGLNLGRELVRRGIAYNLEAWPESDIRIGAQARLERFYNDLGFIVDGRPYEEDGIMHIYMNLDRHQS